MNRRPHLYLVALIVAALVGVGLLAIPGSPLQQTPTLGLDLQGGAEVTLKAVPPKGRQLTEADLDRSVEIMRSRVDRLGVAEPEIRKQGSDQINVALPGATEEGLIEVIGRTAALELYDLEANVTGPSRGQQGAVVPTDSVFNLLSGQQSKVKEGEAEAWYLFDDKKKLRAGPKAERSAILETDVLDGATKPEGEELPKGWRLFGVPENTKVISCAPRDICPESFGATQSPQRLYYLFRNDPENGVPEMTGRDLKLDGTRQDFDTRTNQPIVTMQFTDAGEEKFEDITGELASRGRRLSNLLGGGQKIEQHFAIVLDGEIKSAPSIDWEENPNGIGGGNGAQISGSFTVGEAKDLALVLQTGALPVEFTTLSQTEVSATLGADSLDEAKTAAIAGLRVVALFLLILYRFLGLVAVIGLGIYAALLYATILLFNVTMTLPGFAGLVLTLGVAADANVVIFERIKEESRAGKSVRAAIAAGYAKGFHTIVDANVVTAITAMVLFAVATAGVKGFALMLLIGTAISMLTAIAATRAILGLLAGFKWFDNPKFMGASAQQTAKWIQIDFIGKRNIWFAISGVVMVLSIGAIGLKGLNLGIDFEGGTQVSFTTPQPVALDEIRAETARIGEGNAQVQGTGAAVNGDQYTSFQIRAEALEPEESTALQNGLEDAVDARSFGTNTVSASFGEQIADQAILAIAFSLLLIVIYISVRFQWKFSVPVLIALVHDVLITIGIYALVGREVTTATVAAILTVLGYSIYDTIIIFDRIRENIPLMKRASFRTLANVSLWETVRRSLATTFITLLPIATLFVFGGETLKDFAFALLVGIGSGAYSSIFIAAPLLAMFKEREPEYARRRDDVIDAASVGGVLKEAEAIAAAQPEPELIPAAPGLSSVPAGDGDDGSADSKRERRRQRRSAKPHGRAR